MIVNKPKEPVDGFTIVRWRLGYQQIEEIKLVYHIHRTWNEICPGEEDRAGSDFIDNWQCFINGVFESRFCGWRGIENFIAPLLPTRHEALRAMLAQKQKRVDAAYDRWCEAKQELWDATDALNESPDGCGTCSHGVVTHFGNDGDVHCLVEGCTCRDFTRKAEVT